MKITQAGEYGLLALMHLARQEEGRLVSMDGISAAERIPKDFLAKIMQTLAHAGLVRSKTGAGGGFALVRSPESITVLEVIELIEGKIAMQKCLEETGCERADACTLCAVFTEAQNRLTEVFQQMTVQDLMQPKERVIAKVQTMPLRATQPAPAPIFNT